MSIQYKCYLNFFRLICSFNISFPLPLYLKGAKTRCLIKETVQFQQMMHQSTPGSVMPFLHLHIFNKIESGRVFRQADRGESEHIVDERCSGFYRKGFVIFLESLCQELPIFLVIVHTVITLKAINNDRADTCIPQFHVKLEDIKINVTISSREVTFCMHKSQKIIYCKIKIALRYKNN